MRVALITGGSRGIGRAMVEAFSAAGYTVAFTYRQSREQAEEVAARTGALAIQADSASEADILQAVHTVQERLGTIGVLINNAAVSSFSLLQELSTAEWERTVAVNLTAPFLYTRAVLPEMLSAHAGRIINISSMWGLVGASCEVHYSATKAGLIGMTRALAQEVGPSGITVNAIAPGVIDTDMNRALSEEDRHALCEQTPLMRLGTPEEIAAAALFLAGEQAGFITGQVLNVSGGFVIG